LPASLCIPLRKFFIAEKMTYEARAGNKKEVEKVLKAEEVEESHHRQPHFIEGTVCLASMLPRLFASSSLVALDATNAGQQKS
jgi:hypothetical protein